MSGVTFARGGDSLQRILESRPLLSEPYRVLITFAEPAREGEVVPSKDMARFWSYS